MQTPYPAGTARSLDRDGGRDVELAGLAVRGITRFGLRFSRGRRGSRSFARTLASRPSRVLVWPVWVLLPPTPPMRRPKAGGLRETEPAPARPWAPLCHVGSGSWQLLPQSQPLRPAWKGSPPSPVRVLAELPLPHVVDRTETKLVGARGDQALDRH